MLKNLETVSSQESVRVMCFSWRKGDTDRHDAPSQVGGRLCQKKTSVSLESVVKNNKSK